MMYEAPKSTKPPAVAAAPPRASSKKADTTKATAKSAAKTTKKQTSAKAASTKGQTTVSTASTSTTAAKKRRYRVLRGDKRVLELTEGPGALISMSAPPPRPGDKPVTSPVVAAVFYAPEEEGTLGVAVREAKDLASLLARLRELGYAVEQLPDS